ncbi:hypothetical protein ACFQX6_23810 [Streptosporangium lutulentum]
MVSLLGSFMAGFADVSERVDGLDRRIADHRPDGLIGRPRRDADPARSSCRWMRKVYPPFLTFLIRFPFGLARG